MATTTVGWDAFYIPTHRDETAMKGAPVRFGLVEKRTGNGKSEM